MLRLFLFELLKTIISSFLPHSLQIQKINNNLKKKLPPKVLTRSNLLCIYTQTSYIYNEITHYCKTNMYNSYVRFAHNLKSKFLFNKKFFESSSIICFDYFSECK